MICQWLNSMTSTGVFLKILDIGSYSSVQYRKNIVLKSFLFDGRILH